MNVPRIRRRWIVLATVVALVLFTLRQLYSPLTLEFHRAVDPQTLVVAGFGSPRAWTNLSDVSETPSTVTVTVYKFTLELGPSTASAARLEVEVRLGAPLAGRTVVDGSTGQEIPEATE